MRATKEQKKLRRAFIEKHRQLCNSVLTPFTYRDKIHKTQSGALLVELARSELNYSPNTWSSDILLKLRNEFVELGFHK